MKTQKQAIPLKNPYFCSPKNGVFAFPQSATSLQERSWTVFFCSLNFLLSIVGYPLVMALLSPLAGGLDTGENVFFTYPFRALQMSVALVAFLCVRNRPFPRINFKLALICLFYALYFARAFWDLQISPPIGSSFAWAYTPGRNYYYWCYIAIDSIPLLAVAKGWDKIDFSRVVRWLLFFGAIGLVFSLRSVRIADAGLWSAEMVGRATSGAMMHTQALGTFGAYLSIVAIWAIFSKRSLRGFERIASCGVLALATYIMIRAGSRGPIFGVAVVVSLWFGARRKNIFVGLICVIFMAILFVVFKDQILDVIRSFGPSMAHRMEMTINDGDTSGRTDLWIEYGAEILRNPMFGFQLERLGYPHSMFLDGFMMFGVFAGIIIPVLIIFGVVSIFKAGQSRVPDFWWYMILLHMLVQSFTQSGFSSISLQAPLVLLFILEERRKLLKAQRGQLFFFAQKAEKRITV